MKQKSFLLSTLFLVLHLGTLFSQTKFIPYQQLPDYNGNSGTSGMYFGAVMTSSVITVTFEGPANKWIAFGLGTAMHPTDVFIYTVGQSSSTHPIGWYDYYNSSYNSSGVVLDATQNWSVVSTNTTTSGTRTVTASRVLNTNDLADVAVSFTASSLDLVWARGSSANYTIHYHGSTNRANGISLPWLTAPTASFSAASQTICQGSSVTFSNLSTGGQTSYTWNFPGGNPASSTSTNPVITYTAAGVYSVVLTASNAIGTSTLSQTNFITVTPTVVPSISIGISSGANPQCSGATVTFSATTNNGGSSPSFQWKVNGVNAGLNSSSFSSNSLSNSNTVTCVLLSNQTCVNPSSVTSAGITMTVNSSAPSSVSIVQTSGSNPLCLGSTVGFSASPFNGGSNPSYQWQINGLNAGSNSPNFTSSALSDGDVVSCVVTSNDPCTTSSVAVSSGITMTVSTLLTPSINISIASPLGVLCSGQLVQFTASPGNGGSNPSYQWFVNGVSVGSNTASFSSNSLNHNDVVSCVLVSGLSCASPASVASTPITLSINPSPSTPSISVAGPTVICPGESVTLTSSSANNNVWSNTQLSPSISVSNAGLYSLLLVVNSCSSSAASVSIAEHPVISASIAPLGTICAQADAIVLSAEPSGGVFSGSAVQNGSFLPQLASTTNLNLIVYTNQQTFGNVTCTDTSAILVSVNDCTGISELRAQNENLQLFPNPASDIVELRVDNARLLHLSLYDISGKQVPFTAGGDETRQHIRLTGCNDGLYLLRVDTDTRTHFIRLIKQTP